MIKVNPMDQAIFDAIERMKQIRDKEMHASWTVPPHRRDFIPKEEKEVEVTVVETVIHKKG